MGVFESVAGELSGVIPALIAFAAVLTSAFLGWAVSRWQYHKEYEHNRSEYITRKRFDEELRAIGELSGLLLELVNSTIKHAAASDLSGDEVDDLLRKAEKALGSAAPFLNYIDLSDNGEAFCGVDRSRSKREAGSASGIASCKASDDGGSSAGKASADKNLYLRAREIIDLCRVAVDGNALQPPEKRLCTQAETCEYEGPAGFLRCRYDRFIHCAYCRLSAVESGKKDARRINRRRKRERFFDRWTKGDRYDPHCPYESPRNDGSER